VGHPEHDLLCIATQVARAAGLKDPSNAVHNFRRKGTRGSTLKALIAGNPISVPKDELGRNLRGPTTLFAEAETYQMLLRGHAPASEPFRKWVTGVVLPTIRKTGKFDVNEAQDQTPRTSRGSSPPSTPRWLTYNKVVDLQASLSPLSDVLFSMKKHWT
jgi:prophage antirepressor-like protein